MKRQKKIKIYYCEKYRKDESLRNKKNLGRY